MAVGQLGVDHVPGEVHGVAAHVAHLADAEVPVHVPLQAIAALGEIARVVGVVGRGSEPEVVVQIVGGPVRPRAGSPAWESGGCPRRRPPSESPIAPSGSSRAGG